ncbi:hypothetical protein EAS68_10015 [Legionella jordanis]|nr:hypothetical protein EAS68_10015 [Legionella jordanis]
MNEPLIGQYSGFLKGFLLNGRLNIVYSLLNYLPLIVSASGFSNSLCYAIVIVFASEYWHV